MRRNLLLQEDAVWVDKEEIAQNTNIFRKIIENNFGILNVDLLCSVYFRHVACHGSPQYTIISSSSWCLYPIIDKKKF